MRQNASLPRRLGAMLYDGLLILAVLFFVTVPFVVLRGGEPVQAGEPAYRIVLGLSVYLFFTGFWSLYGRTLGMQSWGLRIESESGGRPRIRQSSTRFIAALLSWLPLGLGFLWQLFDADHLSWHDRLSGTRIYFYPKPSEKPEANP